MPIKHAFVSGKVDSIDPTLVSRDEWNAPHNHPAFLAMMLQFGDDIVATPAFPAPLTEYFEKDSRTCVDLTRCDQARLVGAVQANAGSTPILFAVQYSLDQVAWAYLDAVSGPFVSLTPVGLKNSGWVNITAAAKADVFLRWVSQNGTGAFTQIYPFYLQVR